MDNDELSSSKGGKKLFRKMTKTCSFPMSSMETVSFSDRPKTDIKLLKAEFIVKYMINFGWGEHEPRASSK